VVRHIRRHDLIRLDLIKGIALDVVLAFHAKHGQDDRLKANRCSIGERYAAPPFGRFKDFHLDGIRQQAVGELNFGPLLRHVASLRWASYQVLICIGTEILS
jgi:hypothetical protein